MTGNTAKVLKSVPKTKSQSSSSNLTNSIQTISGRQSKEIFVAFCGAIGAGISTLKQVAREELEELGYEIIDLRVSKLMKVFPEYVDMKPENSFDRYKIYQDLGDKLRDGYNRQILAEAVINEVSIIKESSKQKVLTELKVDNPSSNTDELCKKAQSIIDKKKVAFFIDQLKNPSEVELLRLTFQNNFYLIGVIRSEEERKRNLKDEGISQEQVDILINRDRKSEDKYGQQAEKTILDSDIFIKNNQSHVSHLRKSVKRFFCLIHGVNGITPTTHEKGMFSAFSTSLQSACLSRQVGASILDENNNVIATGKNDVPKAFGGLYSTDDGYDDHRCIHKGGKCYNDAHKLKLKRKIEQLLSKEKISNSQEIADILYDKSGISSILEFSRSIHAEMDAITSIARTGNGKTIGSTLYTTTYPCHNCARHIVAAGIIKAIYIEPYEKSLAIDLHDDAITNNLDQDKVIFQPFEGISPRRYAKFFFPSAERKNDEGKAVKITTKYNHHVDIQYLDTSKTYQEVISEDFRKKVENR
jgi:deoxycytidylate deaminase